MTETAAAPSQSPAKAGPVGFRVIGAFKLLTALAIFAVGFGMVGLLRNDVEANPRTGLQWAKLDPDGKYASALIDKVVGLGAGQRRALEIATFFYGVLYLVEATGLLLQKTWAGYLTVIATASLLPVEIYELIQKLTAVRISVLVVNLAIVVYLIVALVRERRQRKATAGG